MIKFSNDQKDSAINTPYENQSRLPYGWKDLYQKTVFYLAKCIEKIENEK